MTEAKRTARNNAPLQFSADGHILRFQRNDVYVGAGDHVLRVEFVGSDGVNPTARAAQPSAHLRVDGTTPLGTVVYTNVWDGISVTYEASTQGISKSNYLLDAGTSVERIRLRYNNAPRIDQTGDLVFRFATGEIRESAPVAWQVINGKRVPVSVSFRMLAEREVGLTVGSYDTTLPLVIDPTLQWNTFLGGDNHDFGLGIDVDTNGNVYVVGQSSATWGSPIRPKSGATDAFVAKLDSSGALLWNTFLGGAGGGNGTNSGTAIAIDDSGNVYISGTSDASWGTPLRPYAGAADAFAAQLNSSGVLQWNTFFGSTFNDAGSGIAVDASS